MKKNNIVLICFFIISMPFLFSMNKEQNELSIINFKVKSLQEQNKIVVEFLRKQIELLPEDKTIENYTHISRLNSLLQRQYDNLETLKLALPKHVLIDQNLPQSDLLRVDVLDVNQINQDIDRLLKNEDIKDPIEQVAFNWLYPLKKTLPSQIDPYHVTKICTILPLTWSIAAILSADEKSVRKEVVMGVCKVSLLGALSGYLSSYSAKVWNPFRIKLDNGMQEDCELRITSCMQKIDQMNNSIATYCEHLEARKVAQEVIVHAKLAAEKAEEAKNASIKTNSIVQTLSSVADQRDRDTRQRDEESLKRLFLLEEGQAKLLKLVNNLNEVIKKMHRDFKITKQDLISCFNEDQKARDRFEENIYLELGDVRSMQFLQYLQGQRQLYISEQTALQQGVVFKNIPSLPGMESSSRRALFPSSSQVLFVQEQVSKQMMKAIVSSWNESIKLKKNNQVISIITANEIGSVTKKSYDSEKVRNMAAILMQSNLRSKLTRIKITNQQSGKFK